MVRKTLVPFIVFGLLLLGIHGSLVAGDVFPTYDLADWYWIHVFLLPLTIFGLYFIAIRYKKTGEIISMGKNYLLFTVIKMILSIVFFLPWLLYKDETSKPMVIQFFSVFFPFLLLETVLLVRILKDPTEEKLKNGENTL